MTVNRGLPVNLPKAASAQRDLRENFNITVTQDGTIFLNKEPTTLTALGQQVKAGLDKEPELAVIINADDQSLHGAIVAVMDEVRLAGASRIAIAVRPDRKVQP
jgi:biopolymer transport protein ExbD